MSRLRWIVIMLGLIQGAWMTFDGTRAFVVGDYVTPRTSAYAGQLGPWTKTVSTIGIEPRSNLMKTIFVGYGITWLALVTCYAMGYRWVWRGMLIAAVATLWYLWVGTIASLIILVLLLLRRTRGPISSPS